MTPRRLAWVVAASACLCLLLWLSRPGAAKVQVVIPPGLSARETAALLKREGVIPSVTLFKLAAKLSGKERRLKPGAYLLRKPTPVWQVLSTLYRGDQEQVRVVVPEGFMAKQIADRLESLGVTDSDDFMEYVRANNLEGYLFPTTYFFSRSLAADKVAHHMLDEFRRSVEPEFAALPQKRFDLTQAVTLASIVQREAAVIDEMPMVAAVYCNRLSKRMRLEADPTVQYAYGADTGKWEQKLRFKHLEIVSKYNTYLHYGLPPGPICSPGVDAIRAVLRPAQSDAIYFVADNTGRHTFSRTWAEHSAANERAKEERRRLKGLPPQRR
ncbi:MAG: endolytic transglycosylase MltG [Elusimicrobiota bacterium]